MASPSSGIFHDALRFWERGRIFYNLLLLAVTVFWLGIMFIYAPYAGVPDMFPLTLVFFAVVANILYCAAYVVDLPAQLTPYRQTWRRWRWLLWLSGTLLAGLLATVWFYAILVDIPPEF